MANQEHQDLEDLMVSQDHQDHQDLMVSQERQEHQDNQELQDSQEHQSNLVMMVHQVLMDSQELLDLMDLVGRGGQLVKQVSLVCL